MHHGVTPTLSQEQAAARLWLLQHLREWGVRAGHGWLAPEPSHSPASPTWGQLFLVRRVRLLCDGTRLYR